MASESLPDREVLAELLLQWEELYERGQDTPASELARDHPNLIPELTRRINALKTVSWITNPTDRPSQESRKTPEGMAGKTLGGRYRLDELIAEGGFAEVYRAYDTELQRTVAVKIPKRSRLQSTDLFLAEARRVAGLKHDGIVPVHDVGVEGSTCFIVSEFLEGGSLADRLSGKKPTKEEAIRWVCEVADTLEYAHRHGIAHRDVKPANILIDHHGRAKLADFGIAQSLLTTGEVAPSLGTRKYMSPEQWEGQPADHRSDIYSLGLVLYETLTGPLPYSSVQASRLRNEILFGKISASRDLPITLRRVLEQGLQNDPALRYSSVSEWADAVRKAWDGKAYRRRLLVGVLAGATIVVGAIAWWTSWRTGAIPSDPPMSASDTLEEYDPTQARMLQQKWAERLGIKAETTNTIGLTLVVIPPGQVEINEGTTLVEVNVPSPFLMGETEVTQGQWYEVMETKPWSGQQYTIEGQDIPATWVSWEDAVEFCEKLTARERSKQAIGRGQEYRLPTEAEWVLACRAGTDTAYWFGDDPTRLDDYAWFGGGWNPKTGLVPGGNTRDESYAHRTKAKKPNPYGLFDTYGNVWEWVNDIHSQDKPSTRRYKGGGWVNIAEVCTPKPQGWTEAWGKHCYRGFRVVLSPPTPDRTDDP